VLAFVTSLRHPHNSADYARVERLLDDSIASIARQTSDEWTLWVVGNQRPRNLPAHATWVQVDFPPPSAVRAPITGVPAVLLDKGTKLVVGLIAAMEDQPDHVMFFDADDLVSRRLADLSNQHRQVDGWAIEDGWRWSSERRAVRRQPEFYRHCGTAHIVRPALYSLPPDLSVDSTQDHLLRAFGDRLPRHFGSHVYLRDDLADQGHALAPTPFPAALYRVGTGENHSGISLGGFGRPVDAKIAAEFGIPAAARSPTGQLRAVLPSGRALRERLPFRKSRRRSATSSDPST
jgi:hypothetical protein